MSTTPTPSAVGSQAVAVPVIVALGFAGSRYLLDGDSTLDAPGRSAFMAALEARLRDRIAALPAELGLSPAHVPCGVSQVAIGADMLFTRACAALELPQRIFLPQSRDEYLAGQEADGTPDFDPAQRHEAGQLLASPHVIEERVVSDAADRADRFADANLEIIRVSDVLVCLLREHAAAHVGGTVEFLAKGRKRGLPVLELRVAEQDGQPVVREVRHNWPGSPDARGWAPPQLPAGLGVLSRTGAAGAGHVGVQAPRANVFRDAGAALEQLTRSGDDASAVQRRHFRYAAQIIITTHLLATACAVAVTVASLQAPWVAVLLALEFTLLGGGVGMHLWLHRSRAAHSWALYRLTAELAISVQATRNLRSSLEHLFTLPFPTALRPVLHTMHVLHLVISRRPQLGWEAAREAYVNERLEGPRGQVAYYTRELGRAQTRLRLANRCFLVVASIALLITPVKLWLVPWLLTLLPAADPAQVLPAMAMAASVVSILFPMLAVAALSLAASFDLEARVHTYEETLQDLQALRTGIAQADSAREFTQLALTTERELLAETANWASRRSFTSVT